MESKDGPYLWYTLDPESGHRYSNAHIFATRGDAENYRSPGMGKPTIVAVAEVMNAKAMREALEQIADGRTFPEGREAVARNALSTLPPRS